MKVVFFLCLFLIACSESKKPETEIDYSVNAKKDSTRISDSAKILNPKISKKELNDSIELVYNLVDVQSLSKNIYVDLKYASEDNFMKQKVYYSLDRALLQKDVGERLVKCQEYLSSINPDYHLLIYDALRPVEVQWRMWRALDTIPSEQRGKFVSNPVNGSVHNYGAAVDITICNKDGVPLDMGAGFDEIKEIAYPSKEEYYLQTGELNQSQIENRKLLRKVMRSQGFRNLPTEWWHFNACSRAEAKLKYKMLEKEP